MTTLEIVRQVVTIGVGGTLAVTFMRQVRKPTWWIGRFVAWTMNQSHGPVTTWGLSHLKVEKGFKVLDVGCGGGATVQRLADLASAGTVSGVDYGSGSVATARATCAELIKAGRVDIQQGSVSKLPYPDRTFDLVTAVETHYYWPDLVADTREVLRVLKPGGRFAIIAEEYRHGVPGPVSVAMKLIQAKYLTIQEHKDILAKAGYVDIVTDEVPARGWMCAVGRRP